MSVNRNGEELTVSHRATKMLAVNRKCLHPIETLYYFKFIPNQMKLRAWIATNKNAEKKPDYYNN